MIYAVDEPNVALLHLAARQAVPRFRAIVLAGT